MTRSDETPAVRIALISDTYAPQVNGVTTVLQRIVGVLEGSRHAVAVVAPEYPEGSAPSEAEHRVPSLPFPPYPAIRLSLPAPRRVARFLDAFAPELVHVATEGPLGLAGRWYALRRGVPLVTSYHTHFPQYCRHYGFGALEPAAWRWIAWFHRPAALTHTPGEAARGELLAHGLAQAVVWGRGVDSRFFHPARRDRALRHRLGVGDDDVLILHAGRLAPEKNLEVLAAAWTIARDAIGAHARFCVAGEGPEGERLHARMPWATRLGFVGRDTLADLYACADLVVLPSHSETCGLVALEAMASGLPVVAANAGGLAESVAHGATGFLVDPADARGFAAAVCDLAAQPPLRRSMGAAARAFALGRDRAREDAELLGQYASAIIGAERASWRAA